MYCRAGKIIAALIVVVLLFQGSAFAGAAEADFYISPAGDDSNPGTIQKPFATLSRARDAVRELKKTKTDSDIAVLIRGGRYYLKETVVFGLEDSGNKNQSIKYAAYPGEEPVFSSGVKITGWKKVEKYPDALPTKAREKVWVAELPQSRGGKWRFYTLYDGEQRLQRARGEGFAPEKEYPYDYGVPERQKSFAFPDRSILYFPEGALKRWPNLEDIEIIIRPHVQFVMNILALKSVDEGACIARTAVQGSYPLTRIHSQYEEDLSRTCWVENVIDFLDEPGEWVLNTQQGKVYLWPRADEPGDDIFAPCLRELVKIQGAIDKNAPTDEPAKNLVFAGLAFIQAAREVLSDDDVGLQHDWDMEDKDNALFRFRGAENCVIDGCRFANSGGDGVRLDLYCQNITIKNSLFENLGGTGVLLCGYGPGTKDVNKRNQVINNRIGNCSQLCWHSPAIFVWQSGENRIANNLIHNMPYDAIVLSGARPQFFYMEKKNGKGGTEAYLKGWRQVARTIRRDEVGPARTWETVIPFMHTRANIVEDNEIHSVMELLGDGNAIYASGTGPFNVIRRNYIHHVLRGQGVIRTDGWQKDTLIAENIIYKCAAGIARKNYNHVENNIIVDISGGHRGYISFASFPHDKATTASRVQRNICYRRGKTAEFYQVLKVTKKLSQLFGNITSGMFARPEDCDADYNLFYCKQDPKAGSEFIKKMQADGIENHSISADPMFVDLENGDFRLKPNSPALKLGIKQIDVTKIGLTEEFPKRFRKGI